MTTHHLVFGDTTLVRVGYADVLLDPAVANMTAEQVDAIPWAAPVWGEHGQVRLAAAAWVVASHGRRIVVDPLQAADAILRTGPDAEAHQTAVAGALEAAGYPRESVDTVVASHIDGIGMIAWRAGDAWTPFFPNADVLVSRREYDAIVHDDAYTPDGADALLALDALGAVAQVDDEHEITPGVRLRWTGVHSPGHQIVEIAGRTATIVGHLSLSPLQLALAAVETGGLRDRGGVLIGPLWPAPGSAVWDGSVARPVTSVP